MFNRIAFKIISFMLLVLGISMSSSVIVSFFMRDSQNVILMLSGCSLLCLLFGFLGLSFFRTGSNDSNPGLRDGFAVVSGGWLVITIFGMLPFIFVVGMYPADAFFETASGFSTTGATVLDSSLELIGERSLMNGLESLPYGILYWRCLLNWLGGIGFVVFALLILPLIGKGGGQILYNAEVTGVKTNSDQVTPRLQSYAVRILIVYGILTFLCTLCYRLGGMTLFDAVCHSLSTTSTGGFSTKNMSFSYYFSSPILQWTAIIFMIISSCNFILTLKLFVQHQFNYFKDEEFKFFLGLISITVIFTAWLLYENMPNGIKMTNGEIEPMSIETALRCAAFQLVAVISTTGFSTSDYTGWAPIPVMFSIVFLFMFIGGCGGSTSGGMKCARILLIFKHSIGEIKQCIFPQRIPDIRLNGQRLETSVVNKTMAFMSIYMIAVLLIAAILPLLSPKDMDLITSLSASLTCMSNVGPGFGHIGPSSTYSFMSAPAKILLSLTMIAGRLELYTFLVLFLPSFWKK